MDNGSLPPYTPSPQPGYPAPGTGGYPPAPQTGYAPPIPPTGYIPLAPQKKKPKIVLIIAAIVVALGAAAAAVVLWVLPGQKAEPLPELNAPLPLLYEQDGEVYLGSGENIVCLGDVEVILHVDVGFDAMCSFDNSRMIYLADTDEQTGFGTLMMVQTDGLSQPQQIAVNVAAARLSRDGTQVLYVAGAPSGDCPLIGDLYLYIPGEAPRLVNEGVYAEQFGFSSGGGSFYFVASRGGAGERRFSLYTQTGDAPKHLIQQADNNYLTPFYDICVGEDGTVIFRQWNFETDQSDLYLAESTKTKLLSKGATVVQIFGSPDDLLYVSDTKLYYHAPGKRARLITDSYAGIAFAEYQGPDAAYAPKHFVFAESDAFNSDAVTLYELTIGEDPIRIAKADDADFVVHPDFTWVSCFKNGELCLYEKTEDGWNQNIVMGENILSYDFDYMHRQRFFYIEGDGEDAEYGDAFLYSLEDGSVTPLLHYATAFIMAGAEVYALREDDSLHLFADGEFTRFAADVANTQRTAGGIYVFSGPDECLQVTLYPDSDTEPVTVGQDVTRQLLPAQTVTFSTPLGENEQRLFGDLHHDAAVLIDFIINSNADAGPTINPANIDAVLAAYAYASYEVTDDIRSILYGYYMGFTLLANVEGDNAQSQQYFVEGTAYLLYSEELYAMYASLS